MPQRLMRCGRMKGLRSWFNRHLAPVVIISFAAAHKASLLGCYLVTKIKSQRLSHSIGARCQFNDEIRCSASGKRA
jgi:hypothetical protein